MTWLELAPADPFGIQTLPYGVIHTPALSGCAVRIGDRALPLYPAASTLRPELAWLLDGSTLDRLLAAGPQAWSAIRLAVTEWLSEDRDRSVIEPLLVDLKDVSMRLPFTVADYVDFYASANHAANVGRILRPDAEPLPPNWKHLPIGYHGRSGTVVASGTGIRRPNGQRKEGEDVLFGPTARLDLEAEVGFVVGVGSAMGTPVAVDAFDRHVFGAVLLNDWSARDIQAWEYVPLGPFLGKSFATSISGWITPLAALTHARVAGPLRSPKPLPYLDDRGSSWNLDLTLEVRLNGELLSRPPFASMYWTPAQMLAHLTVNGASCRSGDLFGSGTVSGSERGQVGSLLELSWAGREPFLLSDGVERTFLQDGDRVSITATAPGPAGSVIGIAEVSGHILPAAR
ncbi:MAG: fumarylacetoacetase [Pseudonocardiales bacterium]|nr:fumarylacetoacetase [Pseudonocardiales bacterium]